MRDVSKFFGRSRCIAVVRRFKFGVVADIVWDDVGICDERIEVLTFSESPEVSL
jgi:hypothetical protein